MTGVPANELEDLALCYAPPYGNASDAVNTLGTMAENVLNGRVKFVSPFSGEWEQMAAEAMIIDVRPPEMFEKGTFPMPSTFLKPQSETICHPFRRTSRLFFTATAAFAPMLRQLFSIIAVLTIFMF